MRPLLVLILVIVAVATLLVALFSLGGEDPVLMPVAVSDDRGAPTKLAEPQVSVDRPEDRDEPERTAANPSERTAAGTRETVSGDRASYDNSLTGRVFDPDGQPLAAVRITLVRSNSPVSVGEIQRVLGAQMGEDDSKRTGQADKEGNYRFRNLEPGAYFLTAFHPGFSRKEITIPMIPFDGETTQDVTLENGVVVHGYVHDGKTGDPIAGARLTLGPINFGSLISGDTIQSLDDESLNVSTDDTGYYRFANVTPTQWNLTAAAPGYGSRTNRNVNILATTETHNFDFRMEEGKTIAGRVLAPDRSPVVGARVELLGYQQPQSLSAVGITDGAGKFDIPDLVEGAYFLQVRAEGWGIEKRQRVEAPDLEVEVEMTEQGTIMGKVLAGDGSPVTGFAASLHQYVAQTATFGRSIKEERFDNADGTFTMRGVSAGLYGIKIEAAGFAATYSTSFEVVQGLTTTDIVVRMSRGGGLTGRVVDSSTGEPVSGAAISTQDNNYADNALTRMFAAAMPRRTTSSKVRTDKDGQFVIDLLSPEVYQVVVQHPKYPDRVVRNVRVVDGERTDVGNVDLEPGATVEGTVYDAAGAPLPNAIVQCTPTMAADFVNLETRSGPNGKYTIPNIPAGSYKLTATRPHSEENPFAIIIDMRNSEVQLTVTGSRKYSYDLKTGG